ncbi:hypothetical protein PoB_004220500 [Plakobranchus ocellatus]|uniref:Uncharacterized protein n=1 Tax=Plakobranchus ocellatus TaxID=259542 RepID=A0AAV4B540_9GAST|nr:hypothetical protein PoB_004220500 [Plakobranchus ocellatus]
MLTMPRQADYRTCSQFLQSSSTPGQVCVATQQSATRTCYSNMSRKRPTCPTQGKRTSIHIRRWNKILVWKCLRKRAYWMGVLTGNEISAHLPD